MYNVCVLVWMYILCAYTYYLCFISYVNNISIYTTYNMHIV